MSILTRLTAGSQMSDPREGKSTSPSEVTVAEIGMAAGTLDWFAHDLVMQQHCQQTPPDLKRTIEQVERVIVAEWRKGTGPEQLRRPRLRKLAETLWHDFCLNNRMTDADRSAMCGMTDRHWRRGTNEVYKAAQAELQTMATKAYRDVKYQLSADI